MQSQEYIHGATNVEQERLIRQAQTLAPFLHRNINLPEKGEVLEIGCGVGAQISLLAERYKDVRFHGLELSKENLEKAQHYLYDLVLSEKVYLKQGDATLLPYSDNSFDVIVVFFVLEHIHNPEAVIREAKRVMKLGGVIYCTEVVNSQILGWPSSSIIKKYINAYNRYQREAGGDPDIGLKLGGLFHRAGFREIEFSDASVLMDTRTDDKEERMKIVQNWISVFRSIDHKLVEKDLITEEIPDALEQEFMKYLDNSDSVFVYPAKQVKAIK